MMAICYSAESVREATIVNTTQLRQAWDDTLEEDRRCGGGYSPPLPTLVFSSSCASAFAGPNLYGVDRNASFVDGPVDCWGRRVPTLDVAPRKEGRDWLFREVLNFGQRVEPAGEGGKVSVPEEALPEWVRTTFERGMVATGASRL
jgi:hypothetical protein